MIEKMQCGAAVGTSNYWVPTNFRGGKSWSRRMLARPKLCWEPVRLVEGTEDVYEHYGLNGDGPWALAEGATRANLKTLCDWLEAEDYGIEVWNYRTRESESPDTEDVFEFYLQHLFPDRYVAKDLGHEAVRYGARG